MGASQPVSPSFRTIQKALSSRPSQNPVEEQPLGRLGEAGDAFKAVQIFAQFVKASAIELVNMAGTLDPALDQAGFLQDAQVLGYGRPGQIERAGRLVGVAGDSQTPESEVPATALPRNTSKGRSSR